jgi:hypothetical protein
LANQLTLSQPGWADYAHQVIVGNSGFSDLPEPETLNHYFDNFVGLILSSDGKKAEAIFSTDLQSPDG